MKNPYTKITKVTSDENGVDVRVLPQGAEGDRDGMTIRLVPHATYIHMSVDGLADRRLVPQQSSMNVSNVDIVPDKQSADSRGMTPVWFDAEELTLVSLALRELACRRREQSVEQRGGGWKEQSDKLFAIGDKVYRSSGR
jgi:hypothetical protein